MWCPKHQEHYLSEHGCVQCKKMASRHGLEIIFTIMPHSGDALLTIEDEHGIEGYNLDMNEIAELIRKGIDALSKMCVPTIGDGPNGLASPQTGSEESR